MFSRRPGVRFNRGRVPSGGASAFAVTTPAVEGTDVTFSCDESVPSEYDVFIDGVEVATVSSAPWTYLVEDVTPGTFTIQAKRDGVAVSPVFTVSVTPQAPTLTAPATGRIYTVGAAASIPWTATSPVVDAATTITVVWNVGEADEAVVGTDSSAAYGGNLDLSAYAGSEGTLTPRRTSGGQSTNGTSVTVRVLGAEEHSWDYVTNVFAAFLATDADIDDTAGAVTAWRSDKGSFTLAHITNSPAYSATACNGRPAVDFDGSNDVMSDDTIAAAHFPAGAATDVPFVVVLLVRNDTISNGDSYWGFGNSGDADSRHTFFQSTGGLVSTNRVANDNTGPGTISTTETINDTNWHVLTCRFLGTTTTTRIDGAATSVTDTACDAGTLTLNRWTLGARRLNGAAGLFADVTIAAVVHATTLTDLELTAIEDELMEHAGI